MADARALAERPGTTIPELFTRKYDIDATYDLLDRREVTPDAIQHGHRRPVEEELREPGRYLLIEDTTVPSSSHRKRAVPGPGPIGGSEEGRQGFLLQSVLAVRAPLPARPDASGRRPPVMIPGLVDQPYLVRSPRPVATSQQVVSRPRTGRDRESDRRLESSRRIGPAPAGPGTRRVRVADREADIYEDSRECAARGHGLLVRVDQDRVILEPSSGKRLGLVFEHIAGVGPPGGMYLDLRSRDGRQARRARLLIRCGPVRVRAPGRPGRTAGTNEPIDCWSIRLREPAPPEGVEALEWVLYTDERAETLEEALVGAMDHATRSLIEEFHKGLKTGLKAEESQPETADRLFAAIAVMSLVASRLLDLREPGRMAPEAPATVTGLNALESELLGLAVDRTLTTVASVLLAWGRLGGHRNRRGDGMPGWITPWRGMKMLRLMARGAELERMRNEKRVHSELNASGCIFPGMTNAERGNERYRVQLGWKPLRGDARVASIELRLLPTHPAPLLPITLPLLAQEGPDCRIGSGGGRPLRRHAPGGGIACRPRVALSCTRVSPSPGLSLPA